MKIVDDTKTKLQKVNSLERFFCRKIFGTPNIKTAQNKILSQYYTTRTGQKKEEINCSQSHSLLGHKDLFGARRIAIDAPGGRTFIVADSYGKPAVIGSRHFDDFIGFRTLQMQLRAPAGERRFFALNQDIIPTIWNKNT